MVVNAFETLQEIKYKLKLFKLTSERIIYDTIVNY